MSDDRGARWLTWARELQAIAQTGLAFAKDPYDRHRYESVRRVAAEITAFHTDAGVVRIESLFEELRGYATPHVDVRGAAFDAGRVLLVREAADAGRWTLPGGWADVNEAPSEAVAREVLEESGFEVAVRKLAAVYDLNRHPHTPVRFFHSYKLFFVCEIVGGHPRTSVETTQVSFFREDSLPELSLSRVLDYQVRRMFEHDRDRSLPTDFD